jgi:hypothetical protein
MRRTHPSVVADEPFGVTETRGDAFSAATSLSIEPHQASTRLDSVGGGEERAFAGRSFLVAEPLSRERFLLQLPAVRRSR